MPLPGSDLYIVDDADSRDLEGVVVHHPNGTSTVLANPDADGYLLGTDGGGHPAWRTQPELSGSQVAVVFRNPDRTWPARPAGYGLVIWVSPDGVHRGAFAPNTFYDPGDVVTDAGAFYQAKSSLLSAATRLPADWNEIPMTDFDDLRLAA